MRKVAVIDLGTNTFNLLVAELSDQSVNRIQNERRVVKLGEGGLSDNAILPKPFSRGLTAFKSLVNIARASNATEIYALATSGIRSTTNGVDFTKAAEHLTGVKIQIINGDQEAILIYKGVIGALHYPNFPVLIMDIGGGSTEFVIANRDGILWKHSFQIGVSRLTEVHRPSNPVNKQEISMITLSLQSILAPLLTACSQHQPCHLIGSAGSFDSFAQMLTPDRTDELAFDANPEYEFDRVALSVLLQKIIVSTYEERLLMPGLIKMRADMIVLAALQLQFVLSAIEVDRMSLSTYSMKEGYAFQLTNA